jgi:HD superfamily phosphohydrolase
MVHLVYPGATHTRFSHALGSLRVVQDLLDIILGQRDGRHADPDLFEQWEAEFDEPRTPGDVPTYEWRIAEAIVLARLGSLLHDLCHVPYGHTIEDDLEVLTPHDENLKRLEVFWEELGDNGDEGDHAEVQKILNGSKLRRALTAIILSKRGKTPADEQLRKIDKYPFVADLVTNTICADLLDYLPRDHKFTGLPAALGQRFMTAFYVVPASKDSEERHFPERMALRISDGGRERPDISSELLKHLRYRYELQERAIVHHAKLAADSMLGKALEMWTDEMRIAAAARAGGAEVKRALSEQRPADAVWVALTEDRGARLAKGLQEQVKWEVEARICRLGDDSLLEYLAGTLGSSDGDPALNDKVRAMAGDLLNRRLYKRAAQAAGTGGKKRLHELFGGRSKRRELERDAARFAGVPEEQVVIWLPDPRMRLKVAEVLVDYGQGVAPFNEYSDQGREIYADHENLWTTTVFVHKEVVNAHKEPVILARLAERMEVEWDRHKPSSAKRPKDWPLCLAGSRLLEEPVLEEELQEFLKEVEKRPALYRLDGSLPFDDLCDRARPAARRIKGRRPRGQN